jgi:serine protease inhibitor
MMSKAITKTIRFIVDRPFYCAIVGYQGKLLFHGWVFNPQSA